MGSEAEKQNHDGEGLDRIFLADIRTRMATIADCIFRLEEQIDNGHPADTELIRILMREFHTVKACAEFDSFSSLAMIAHTVEDYLILLSREHLAPERKHLDLLYTVVDFTLQVLAESGDIPEEYLIKDANELIDQFNAAIQELSALVGGMREEDGAPEDESDYIGHRQDDLDLLEEEQADEESKAIKKCLDTAKRALVSLERDTQGMKNADEQALSGLQQLPDGFTAKMDEKLRRLLDEVVEVLRVAVRTPSRPEGCELGILSDVMAVIRNCCADLLRGGKGVLPGLDALHEMVTDLRWQLRVNLPGGLSVMLEDDEETVSLLDVADMVRKISSHAAKDLGKQVVTETDVDDISIRKSCFSRLNVALVHLVRNAVDHGIESAEERSRAGKTAEGHILFRAGLRDDGRLCVEVCDDGKGLQRERIISKVSSEDAAVTDSDITAIIMNAGFSTADTPTMYSGRGMGMYIVKGSVEEMNGQIEITSREGEGMAVRICIPYSPGPAGKEGAEVLC